jgi:hypothetical protein
MADWEKISPGGAVRIVLYGDRVLAEKHIGEAMNQLFILKNRMKLGGLSALSAPSYILPDGTVIRVQSIFGQDQVVIDSKPSLIPGEIAGEQVPDSCTISLPGLPTIIQPMQHQGVIYSGEVIGTDYIKTPYSIDVSKCKSCRMVDLVFSFRYKKPAESRSYKDPVTGVVDQANH